VEFRERKEKSFGFLSAHPNFADVFVCHLVGPFVGVIA
jgi:hypothetical protein